MFHLLYYFLFISFYLICNSSPNDDCTGEQLCQIDESSLRFFVLGDFGGQPVYPYKSFTQKRVAKKIAEMGQKRYTHFQMELGDNFYIKGVENVNDSRFKV